MKFPLWNRREFVTRSIAAVAASRLLPGSDLLHAQTTPAAANAPIIHRTLGKTGISLPIVSMGANVEAPGVLARAYELGVRHFDTAAVYQSGRNEERLGSVIKELGIRDKVTIATKIHLPSPQRRAPDVKEQFRTMFEGSLKRLQMDHVDILYYHAVDSAEEAALQGPLEVLQALKKEGKTRFIGISTHTGEPILKEVIRLGIYDVVLLSINYTMAADKGLLDAIDQAAKKGLGLVAMKTQAGGRTRPDPKLARPLTPASQTALLKWVLRNKSITTAIPGFGSYEHLEQGFSVARNLDYTEAEKDFLADKKTMAQAEFCAQCGECRTDCPSQVDIPTLMRSHMYAVQYAQPGKARDTLAGIDAGRGLDACRDCLLCKVSCRRTVNVARKISDLKELTAGGLTFLS